jgi:hypothetical protein
MADRNNDNQRIQPERQSKNKCKEHIEKYLEDVRSGKIIISEEEKKEDELDSDYEIEIEETGISETKSQT